jgi:hypothetical protein
LRTSARWASVIGPICEDGGISHARSVTVGPLRVEHRDQRLADCELGNHLLDVNRGILAKGIRGHFDRFLIAGGKCAQRMLDAVAKLSQHDVGNILRTLRHEVHADALGTNQANDLLDLLDERRRGVVEHEVRFVEEEDESAFGRRLGQALVELDNIQSRKLEYSFGDRISSSADSTLIIPRPLPSVCRRSSTSSMGSPKRRCHLLLNLQEPALNRTDRRRRDVASASETDGSCRRQTAASPEDPSDRAGGGHCHPQS